MRAPQRELARLRQRGFLSLGDDRNSERCLVEQLSPEERTQVEVIYDAWYGVFLVWEERQVEYRLSLAREFRTERGDTPSCDYDHLLRRLGGRLRFRRTCDRDAEVGLRWYLGDDESTAELVGFCKRHLDLSSCLSRPERKLLDRFGRAGGTIEVSFPLTAA